MSALASLIGAVPSVAKGSAVSNAALSLGALSNPFSAGLSILSALGGLGGGSVKISAAKAEAQSGLGGFTPKNKIKSNAAFIDFSEPLEVAALAVVAVVAIYIYKKVA